MATKKNIELTYDIEKLFEDFTTSRGLSEDEQSELAQLKDDIARIEEDANTILDEFNPIKISAHTQIMKGFEDERESFELLEKYTRFIDLTNKASTGLSTEETDEFTRISSEISKKKTEIQNIRAAFASLEAMKEAVELYKQATSSTNVDKIVENFIEFVDDESIKSTYTNLKTNLDNCNNEITSLKTRVDELELKAATSSDCSLENFKDYLKSKDLSTVHAEEIYNYFYNEIDLKMEKNSIKIRKGEKKFQPIRDQAIKKGLIPTAITSAAIGGVVSSVATSGLSAGSKILNLIPVMSSQALTTAVTATIGVGAGLVLTPVVFYAKNKLTKAHYNLWYKNAKENLSEYENGTELEDLPITKLMLKIQNTKHKILKLNSGNWFTKALKFVPKHILNAVNRNRIHHVEAYTQDLFKMFMNKQRTEEEISKIYDLIKTVENFVDLDSFESKLNAMLTCKENGKHTHKSTIENIDIYANLKIALTAIAKQNEASIKTSKKNLTHKKTVASNILNNGAGFTSLLSVMIARNAELHAGDDSTEPIDISPVEDEDTIIEGLDDHEPVVDVDHSADPIVVSEPIDPRLVEGSLFDALLDTDAAEPEAEVVSEPQPRTTIDETRITRQVVLDRLKNDEEFKKDMLDKGFKKADVANLIKKLTEVLESEKRKTIKPKTNYGKLYVEAIDAINQEQRTMRSPEQISLDDIINP